MPIGRLIVQSDAATQEVGGGSAFRTLMANIDRNFKSIEDEEWPPPPVIPPQLAVAEPGLRLSALTGVAVTATEQLGVTSIYGVATGYNAAATYNTATATWVPHTFAADLPLALTTGAHVANAEYPVFLWWDAAALALKLGTGPRWPAAAPPAPQGPGTGAGTSETESFEGRLVNKNPIVLINGATTTAAIPAREALLVGGFATHPTIAGTTEDSSTRRLLSNLYNATPRSMRVVPSLNTWLGNENELYRQAAGDPTNQLEFFSISGAYPVDARVHAGASGNTVQVSVAIGLDTLAPTAGSSRLRVRTPTAGVGDNVNLLSTYNEFPGAGRHTLKWLELNGTAGPATFVGDAGDSSKFQTGIFGTVIN